MHWRPSRSQTASRLQICDFIRVYEAKSPKVILFTGNMFIQTVKLFNIIILNFIWKIGVAKIDVNNVIGA